MNIFNYYISSFYKTPIDTELEKFINSTQSLKNINRELLVGISLDSLRLAVPYRRQSILEHSGLSKEDISKLCEALQEVYHTENPF